MKEKSKEAEAPGKFEMLKSKFKKKEQAKIAKPKEKDVPFIKLFFFADAFDKLLIFIGIIGAIASASFYPLIFYLYGNIASSFVDFETYSHEKLLNKSSLKNSSFSNNTCTQKIEKITNTDFDSRVTETLNMYVTISFLALFSNYLANVCLNTSAERQIKKMRQALFESILRQDIAFFDKNTPGEINSVVISNMDNIKNAINFKFTDFLSLFGRGLGCFVFAFAIAWKFSVVFLALIPLMILSLFLMIRIIKKYTIEEFKAYGKAGSVAQEILSSIRTVISFGIQKKAIDSYETNLQAAEITGIKKGLYKGIFEGLYMGLYYCCFGIGIVYATYLQKIDPDNYNIGNLMSAFFSLITTTFAIAQALPYLKDLAEARGVAAKVFEIIETKSKIDIYKTSDKKINNLKGELEFENIHFSYPQRSEAQILKGLNLKIPAGKTVAFCGSSGCGKSTTFGLLQRFYLPNEGKIKLDGENIDDLNLLWLREQMALVSQEPILFTTTIKENIRLGRLDATENEIIEAAKSANAHDFIMLTSNKYDTQVGERGTQLSGGQKQRIAIARALLRNPKILLLDEATSALDNESEKIVQDALDKAKIGRTTLIIAHRLSTIRNADLIVGFENGIVKEIGTHDELMELKGIYYRLCTSQTKENKNENDNEIIKHKDNDEDLSSSSDSDSESEKETLEVSNQRRISKAASIKKEIKASHSDLASEKLKKKKKFRIKKLFRYEKKLLKIQKPNICWIVIGTISQAINGALMPAIAILFSQIYSIFTLCDQDEQLRQSLQWMGVIMAIGVGALIVTILLNYSLSLAGSKLTTKLRILMFKSMLKQEISFHDLPENRSSILSTQLSTSAPFCRGLTSDKVGLLAQGFSGIGFAVILSFALNWQLALIMLLFVPIAFFSGTIAGRANTNTKVKGKYAIEEAGRITTETVENIRTVVSLTREKYFIDEFKKIFDKDFSKTLAVLHVQALFYSISNVLIFFIQTSAFSFGWMLLKNNSLALTDLYRIYAAMTFSSMTLGRVYAQLPDQTKAKSCSKTVFKIIDRKSKIDSLSEDGIKINNVIGKIEFKNINFEYTTRPGVKILNNFNLSVNNGETNALVGPSGCGKSTTISLLLRFYDPTGGEILLDGVDIKKLNIQWLRSQIGIVSQEPILFNYSIFENISNGDTSREKIPIEEIIEAAKQSNIDSRIESLPEKYETNVGSKGSQLSGGEKQRIAIARALIRKPKILLLDEATSALDTQSEQVVQEALENAQKGRTCIVIAHRLSTIQDANKITVVKDGTVIEEGDHLTLMQNKSIYYKLQTQNRSLAN